MTTRNRPKEPAGERLKALREARDLTKTALGKVVGCTGWAISNYEWGKRTPNGPIAFALYQLTQRWGSSIKPDEWEKVA